LHRFLSASLNFQILYRARDDVTVPFSGRVPEVFKNII